ncbi:MAG: excinuclease ABC subunit UvrC, partial [Clostridia bacterium]|nr:excinuclease ABC subunit UvrC [Clostridia bacterium]
VYFTLTELEALIQENQFIKQFQPRYNIKLKDGGGYPYIKMTNTAYPEFSIVYKRSSGNDKYFGPYSSHNVAKRILETVKKAFSLPSCSKEFPKDIGKGRPCLNYHIGRCCAPCIKGNVSSEEYKELCSRASILLKGDGKNLVEQLERDMEIASEGLNFELAAKLRDCIFAVEKLSERQQIVCSPNVETDIIGIYADDLGSALSLLFVRGGAIVDRENFFFGADEIINSSALVSFLQRYYELRGYIPKKIYIDYALDDADKDLLNDWLTSHAEYRVSIQKPERGDMRALTLRASENAKQLILHKRASEDKKKDFLVSLASLLGLEVVPDRIESYDISHSGGDFTTCGMIVLEHGVFAKRKYRAFNIKTVDDGNDLAALEESIRRRFAHDTDEQGWEYPDLMLIDGGNTQVNRVRSVLNELGINIKVFGMVKDEHHKTRTLTDGENEVSLITRQDAFVFIYKIQEEVHRYSLSVMDSKRRASVKKSSLTEIKGIGAKKANDLMLHFGTLARLKTATKSELTEVKGITEEIAESIIEYFGKENNENNNRNSKGNKA